MATTTNYGWTTPDDTALVKDGASAIRSLGTAIDTTTYNNAQAAIAKTIVDAKGDIIAATAADTVARLAVGSNDQVLTADSSTATGLKWATAAVGGMTLIQETVANANSSITFGSIPGTYKQLLLTFHGLYHTTTGTAFGLRINNSSSSEYSGQQIGMKEGVVQQTAQTATLLYLPEGYFGEEANLTDTYRTITGNILIDNYASTTKQKMYYGSRAFYFNAGGGVKYFHTVVGTWENTNAITSLDIVRTQGSANLTNKTDTSIRLYGIS